VSLQPESKPLSYASGTSSVPLLGKTIGQVLDTAAAKYPDKDALVVCHQKKRYSYFAFREEVEIAARGLMSLGVQKGDRVGIWATNCAEWVVAQFATAKIGAILVSVNPSNRAFELEYVLRQSECQTLLLIGGFRDSNYVEAVRQVCPEIDASEPCGLHAAKLPGLRNLIFIGGAAPEGMMAWNELLQRSSRITTDQLREREASLEFDDSINIQYTSGTTGFPKGAMLSHHNIVNNGMLIADSLRFTHLDRLCIPVPFYHCFGMVLANMACVATGATMVVPAPHFDAEATLRAVQEERCTALHGVPTMFIAELDHPRFAEFDLSTLRTGIMSGAPCPIEIMKRVVQQMHCRELTIAYGMTEASPVITQTTPDDPIEARVTTVGKPLPHTEVKIIDRSTGKILPLGESGELCTRGYLVMKGYYRNDEGTRAAIDNDGWLHTGDLAAMDERGYCNITGRAKDVIIRGGENIYPREIEEFLYGCPGVAAVQVVGIPDRKYGEQVVAWVKRDQNSNLTVEDVLHFCEGKIAHFKIPKHIKIVEEFPLTVTGKVQKFKIREAMTRELGLTADSEIETA
jgi:fatty-acyl-CoA synthase